ncbi:MAG: hypothetical protein EXS51_00975 [Candidatus Taylorbacteria bacterium]|nr:hypothetical protein [Candidatus Taylorbacteria bacterium]
MIPNRKIYRKAQRTSDELRTTISALDLECIRVTIAQRHKWRDEILNFHERRYRNFLILCGSTGAIIIPNGGVDIFWHCHILDTLKYARDCEQIFGFYLHHFPYLGSQGDEAEFRILYAQTKQLYEATFGEAYEMAEAVNHDGDLSDKLDDGAKCG